MRPEPWASTSPMPPPAAWAPGPAQPDRRPNPPLPAPLAVLSVLLFAAVSALGAAIEVLLVPLRAGTTIVPVTVALAGLTNVVVPLLSRRAVAATVAATLPVAAWLGAVVVLSQSRPEGDLLLPAIHPLSEVTYALLGAGALCGLATVVFTARPRPVRPAR